MPIEICGSVGPIGPRDPRTCVEGIPGGVVVRMCSDGSVALDPLYRRPVDPATGAYTGPWQQVDDGGCPEDPEVTLSAADFRRLPLAPSPTQVQPVDGRVLVNVGLIGHTDPAPQTLTTTVLGVPVTVRATPVAWSWDFGDGSAPLVTDAPGAPYPDRTVAHPYPRAGEFALTLVTTWSGEYQVAGAGPWLPVTGTATTISPAVPVTAVEARNHLVAGP